MPASANKPLPRAMAAVRPLMVPLSERAPHREAPIPLRFKPSDLQYFRARSGFELACVHGHGQHAVIADGAGQFDKALLTEASLQRLHTRLVNSVLAEQLPREFDDLGILRWKAARVVLTDRCDCRFRHAEAASAARLGTPHINRFQLARDCHCCEDAYPHIERALEAHKSAEMRNATSEFRAMEKHRERPLQGAAALRDGIHDRAIFLGDLILAADCREPCHARVLSLGGEP